jgi:hypothetical protein
LIYHINNNFSQLLVLFFFAFFCVECGRPNQQLGRSLLVWATSFNTPSFLSWLVNPLRPWLGLPTSHLARSIWLGSKKH